MATRDWERQLREWASPPGKTEEARCENALSAIKNALSKSEALKERTIEVFSQGSYRNNTNVRSDSDVDIGVLCRNTFFYDLPNNSNEKDYGFIPATYSYDSFKSDIERALKDYFGERAVSRGNKALDVHETSYHVEADVAPFFEYRWYSAPGRYNEGVSLKPDNSPVKVFNWPEQHYSNGVEKNKATRMRFKSIVRALKALSIEMEAAGVREAAIPGFLIECLVWNSRNEHFESESYLENARLVIAHVYNQTKVEETCSEWGEVSELKYLFRPQQKWTRQQANAFMLAAWQYLGL